MSLRASVSESDASKSPEVKSLLPVHAKPSSPMVNPRESPKGPRLFFTCTSAGLPRLCRCCPVRDEWPARRSSLKDAAPVRRSNCASWQVAPGRPERAGSHYCGERPRPRLDSSESGPLSASLPVSQQSPAQSSPCLLAQLCRWADSLR